MRISVVGISLFVALTPMSCGARSGIEGLGGEADAGLPAAEGAGGSPVAEPGAGGSFSGPLGAGGLLSGVTGTDVSAPHAQCETNVAVTGKEQMRVGPCTWHVATRIDPDRADMTFYTPSEAISLTRVEGPEGCDAVAGQGWYLVPNVPGIIVMAPAVTTFEVCHDACQKIPDPPDQWGLRYDTCG